MKYEIWITDKAGIPTFVKEYPYKIQRWTWVRGRRWNFKDARLEIREKR